MEKEGIDYFNPAIVMAFLMAVMSDAAFITFLFWFIPAVGLVIAAGVLLFHYFAAFFLLFLVLPKLKHFPPKLILLLGILLPLPTLSLGIALATILQNRLIEFAVKAAAIIFAPEVAIPVATALEVVGAGEESLEKGEGMGEALKETVVAGAEAAVTSASAGKAAKVAKTAEGGKTAEETVEIAAKTGGVLERKPSEVPEAEKEAKKSEVSEEALGGGLEPQEELQRELFGGETGLEVPHVEKKTEGGEKPQADKKPEAKVLQFPAKQEEDKKDKELPEAA